MTRPQEQEAERAAEEYMVRFTPCGILHSRTLEQQPDVIAVKRAFLAGATHVRASLAPELEKLKTRLEHVAGCRLPGRCPACRDSNSAALEILSRLMGKGEV